LRRYVPAVLFSIYEFHVKVRPIEPDWCACIL